MPQVPNALALLNFPDSYDVNRQNQLIVNELNWLFNTQGVQPPEALFIGYAYDGPDYATYFKEVSDIFQAIGIQLMDINNGDPADMILNTQMFVIGGGNMMLLKQSFDQMVAQGFNPYIEIKNRIRNGVPFLGWNQGAEIASPFFFKPPNMWQHFGIGASPFQIVTGFLNGDPLSRPSIKDFLLQNPIIKQVICQVNQQGSGGSSVRLEETGAGMIDSATEPYPIVIKFKLVDGHLQENIMKK